MKTLKFLLITLFILFRGLLISATNTSDEDKNRYASFPGGDSALSCYILSHLNYPQRAIDLNLSGIINIQLEIDEEGRVIHSESSQGFLLEIRDQIHPLIDEMPKWNPALRNGKPFKSKVLLPIQFQLR